MDSPEPATAAAKTPASVGAKTPATVAASTATSTTSSSSSPPVQESPFSNFLSNLSPIKSVKGPHVLQGFLGLNSSPLVFTSPQINARRGTSLCKSPPCDQPPSAEISQNHDGGRKFVDDPGNLEKSDSLLRGGLVVNSRKDNDLRSSVQVQPSSSLGCVDEYLADPVDVDCVNFGYGVNKNLKQSSDVPQSLSGRTDSKKALSEFDEKNDIVSRGDVAVAMFGKDEEDIQGNLTFDIKPIENEENKTLGGWPSNECPKKIESNSTFNLASERQQSENSRAQNAGSATGGEFDQTYEDFSENVEAILHGPHDIELHNPEASIHQRGMSRRCLQFEEAQPKVTEDSSNPSNKSNVVIISTLTTIPVESESQDTSHVDLNATSSKRQRANLPQPVTAMFHPCHIGKSPLTVSKPSGIGLHLNNVVKPFPKGHGEPVGVNLASAEPGMLENKASIAANSLISESFDDMGPLNWLPPADFNATPLTKRKFNSEHTDNFEISQLSPEKKRKKSLSTIDGDGCKRCNCKKTKCLKLYCDCFAAGIYCAEPCACQGCFNRPEYEDTVLETRQQIESRNPLAFAPKIIQPVTEFPDDGNHFTPSSARHKRGCNCKKSMCLKKYCECYQANVGCSSGCRCESCKNVYGRKEEYVGNEEMVNSRARPEGASDSKLETFTNKNDFLHAELYDSHNLTPLTPSFQCSDCGNDASKSGILSGRYVPSPESDLAILSSYAKSSRTLNSSNSNEMLMETNKKIVDVDSFGQGRDYNSTDMVDQFSSRYQSPADLCDFTPLLDFPSMAMASSASSKATGWKNVSRLQLCPRSCSLSSDGSLRWRSSPVTPITQLGGTKSFQALDSDSRLSGIPEDDTPEVLTDASIPHNSIKVSSPSRKRVSPPHGHAHERGSSYSGPLKSGRKFILKAVPSFPPLTPCIDSKESTDQKSFPPCIDSKGSTDQEEAIFKKINNNCE